MKKHMIEQALTDIDPVFVAEAGTACTAATVRRPAWKRTLLVAACLALAFAFAVGASGLYGDWNLWFITDEVGNREMAGEILYGGTELPEESKQLVREKAAGMVSDIPGENWYLVRFDFTTLDEMEAFLGTKLIRSSLYPVSTEEEIYCTVSYSYGDKMGDSGVYSYESFSGHGRYAFDTGVWNPKATKNPCKIVHDTTFYFRETDGAHGFETSGFGTEETQFTNRELPALSTTATVATKLLNGGSSYLFFCANDMSYNIFCSFEPDVPTDFLNSLY